MILSNQKNKPKTPSQEFERALEARTEELQKKVEELENTRKASLNLLEDLEKGREELSLEKAKDEALLSSIGDGVIATDMDERITLMNPAAQRMLGWYPENMVGRLIYDVVSIEDEKGNVVPREKRPITLALKDSTTTGGTYYYYIRKDKTKFPAAIVVTPVIIDKKIIGVVEIFRDITKEKEIDKTKTEFVLLASHQLRTPPTSINWFLEMLLSGDAGPLSEKQKEYTQEAYQNSQRMVNLVNTLLNISRTELGTFPINPEPTDMIAFTKDILEEFILQIKEKELQVKEQYATNLSLIPIDSKILRIVVQNIISNAVKYTPEKGTISIKIFLQQANEVIGNRKLKTNSLVVSITDTGYGIPRNQSDKIFTKLFRADNVKDKDTDGTGLGLYLAKLIVDHVQGNLWFESELDKGTTFYLAVPSKGMEKKEGGKELMARSRDS